MNPTELYKKIQNGEDWCILDVREPEELLICQLPHALHIPMQSIPQHLNELPRNKPIAIMCHLGYRSQTTLYYLMQTGFDNVYNLDGGMEHWALSVDTSLPRY